MARWEKAAATNCAGDSSAAFRATADRGSRTISDRTVSVTPRVIEKPGIAERRRNRGRLATGPGRIAAAVSAVMI